jgi:hypothetical protein
LVLKDFPALKIVVEHFEFGYSGPFWGYFAVIFTKTMPFNGNFSRFRRLGDLYHKTK